MSKTPLSQVFFTHVPYCLITSGHIWVFKVEVGVAKNGQKKLLECPLSPTPPPQVSPLFKPSHSNGTIVYSRTILYLL